VKLVRIRPGTGRSRGLTFVELSVAMVVLLVALLALASGITGVSGVRSVVKENAIAAGAARNTLEAMRQAEFAAVFALYNTDPADDPDGPGTAPGARFAADPLDPAADSPDGLHGEVFFPTIVDAGAGLQLREDLVNDALGTPRDLSGDSIIDDEDHAGDYFVLPVMIRVRWRGKSGTQEYALHSALSDINRE